LAIDTAALAEATDLAYAALLDAHPGLGVNPPGALIELLFDPAEIAAARSAAEARLAARGLPQSWARIGLVHEDQYSAVLRDAVRFVDAGELGTYLRYLSKPLGVPGVVVLPVHRGKLVLLRHFRHATRAWHLEFPRGFGEAGAPAEENARRELLEEIGGVARRLEPVGQVQVDTALIPSPARLFFAELERYASAAEGEGIGAVLELSVAEFEERVRAGEIDDGFTLAAFCQARVRGLV
jgi:ADP-ribose pyrophosphatase